MFPLTVDGGQQEHQRWLQTVQSGIMEKDGLCLKNTKGMEGWNPGMLDSGAWGYIYI